MIFYSLETKPPTDLETVFFDLETEMENNMCRDQVCMSEEHEKREFSGESFTIFKSALNVLYYIWLSVLIFLYHPYLHMF